MSVPEDYDRAFDDIGVDLELVGDVAASGLARVGEVAREIGGGVVAARWQVPRLARLRRMRPQTKVSLARTLADQARAIPDRTFFLWGGRAFTYADANRRVDAVVRGLIAAGVRAGTRVGVLMDARPSYLSLIGALSRLRAIAVLLSPRLSDGSLARCLELGQVESVVADPALAARARVAARAPVLVLGGGPPGSPRRAALPDGVVDLEAVDPDAVPLPAWYRPDRGRADELAMVVFTAGPGGEPRAARISNRRWASSAYGAAAACTLTPRDTVYCCVPLHHMAGALVAAGGALVGGARLALAPSFRPAEFWDEARRYGATVVFYAGDMCRALVDAPPAPGERSHPVRLFAGSGMRVDVWRRLIDRFGPLGVMEFYASTEGNALLANAAGDKIGALGRPMPGSSELALVDWDFGAGAPARGAAGRGVPTERGQPGMLVARIDELHPLPGAAAAARLARDLFAPGDTWYVTGDLLRRDGDGDYWFVDRAADMIRTAGGPVSTVQVEDALHRCPDVAQAAVYAAPGPAGTQVPAAAIVLRPGVRLDRDRLLAATGL
jgi:putative long chain acyl-CoA synthase